METIQMNGQAICKDCGNGTLNNAINEQFVLCDFNDDGNEVAVCKQCGGQHIDGELYFEEAA
jgi:hypothetical protein